MILSLYASGMTTRVITSHMEEIYVATVSAATISGVTDVVADEIARVAVPAAGDGLSDWPISTRSV